MVLRPRQLLFLALLAPLLSRQGVSVQAHLIGAMTQQLMEACICCLHVGLSVHKLCKQCTQLA